MAKVRSELSLDDLDSMDKPVESSDLESRLNKVELFMRRFDGSNMNLTDRQVVYHSTFTAILQGLLTFTPSMLNRPDMLYNYLKQAKNAAELALVLHDGGTKADFTGEFKKKLEKDDD
jgi:hypothetical protein